MVFQSDKYFPRVSTRTWCLCVAFETEIGVALDQHLRVHGAVRLMADHAAFAHGLMLKNMRARLLAVTLCTGFIQPRHRQPTRWLHDVQAVRIMALDAIHLAFDDRVMLRQVEFRVRFQMAGETSCRVFAGIDDELIAPATRLDMQAARPVTGFAPGLPGHFRTFKMNPRVRTGREGTDVIRVAQIAGLITNERSTLNPRRRYDRAPDRRTGTKHDAN